jgi:hypothetical protein
MARWASVALGGSFALPAILVFLALSTNIPVLCLLVTLLFLQIWLLRSIERYSAGVRVRIWAVSLAAHTLAIAAALLLTHSWAILLVLIPELISGALHVRGLQLSHRSWLASRLTIGWSDRGPRLR